jgi:hypothetical protein
MGRLAFVVPPLVALAVACQAPGAAKQTVEVREQWARSVPAPDGQLQIVNVSGAIEIEAREGTSLDIRAEKIAHGTSEQAARDLLSHVNITIETAENGLTVQTERIAGVLIGASFDVVYHVAVPPSTPLRVRSSRGDVTIAGSSERLSVMAANGSVTGRMLSGRIEVRATNGNAKIDVAEVGREPIDIRAVNGFVQLGLPVSANANVSLTSANGRADVAGLPFENFGDPIRDTRRIRGRINGGGTPIDVNAVNGDIHVAARTE